MLRRARAAYVMIATIALAAPTTAAALGTPAPPAPPAQGPSSLRLRADGGQVQPGRAVVIDGRAPLADAGARVVLERGAAARAAWPAVGAVAWRPVATARVGRRGRFSFRLAPLRSAAYRAVVAGPPVAWMAVSSGPLRLVVRARFRVTSRKLDTRGGGRVTVTGRLLPAAAGRTVVLQRRAGGAWRAVARQRTGLRGGFALHWRLTGGPPARLRLVFQGDAANGRSAVALGTAVVLRPSVASWYYDGGSTACGFHATYGVANRTLPCGTRVTISRGGRTVTAVVDDRGPYVWGRSWDLSQTTAAALAFSGVGTVWVAG